MATALVAGNALAEQPPAHRALVPDQAMTSAPDPGSAAHPAPHKTLADFPVWKRITIGTHNGVNGARVALEAARMGVGDSADEILGRPAFPFSRTKVDLDLVILTPRDIGLQARASLPEIYRAAMQLGFELCPAEAGPAVRLAYANQPVGEFLHVAMQPIATYRGDLTDLTVANGGAGLLLLGGDASPDTKFNPATKFVFVRPARIADDNPAEHPAAP
jgi:hypothetical protein